jgi:hypothetical protein
MLFVYTGIEPKKYPTSELIRRKNAGQPLQEERGPGFLSVANKHHIKKIIL